MAVIGAVLGDIIGSQYEQSRPINLDWRTIPLVPELGNLHFTDDTVMTLAIKKALLSELDIVETMFFMGRRYPECEYGQTFGLWLLLRKQEPYNSWGNGSAMRVSFVGERYEDFEEMQDMAVKTAVVTHNHPEGIKGAVVTATCIWMAKHGKSKNEIYDYVLAQYPAEKYQYSIDRTLDEIRPSYKWSVSCMDTVPVAMRCFYESIDYESFIRNIFSLECDSDTFGAVAGGVAEEFYRGFGSVNADSILSRYLSHELYELLYR